MGILDIFTNDKKEIIKNPINISTDIRNIESIEEVKIRFNADITVSAEWVDKSLIWNDLKQDYIPEYAF